MQVAEVTAVSAVDYEDGMQWCQWGEAFNGSSSV